MEFFERLRERAKDVAFKEPRKFTERMVSVHWMDAGAHEGIDATIEALKEMMVGSVIKGSIRHGSISYTTKPLNTTVLETAEGSLRIARDHHDTDGEEVAVLVVRL